MELDKEGEYTPPPWCRTHSLVSSCPGSCRVPVRMGVGVTELCLHQPDINILINISIGLYREQPDILNKGLELSIKFVATMKCQSVIENHVTFSEVFAWLQESDFVLRGALLF